MTVEIFLIIVVIAAIVGGGIALTRQKKQISMIASKSTSTAVSNDLQLLASIPAANWEGFINEPERVSRALGIASQQAALINYNQQLIDSALSTAAYARREEQRMARLYGHNSPSVTKSRRTAEKYEQQAHDLASGK